MATPTSMFGMSPLDILEQRIQQQEKSNQFRRAAQSQAGQSLGIFAPLYEAGLGFSDLAGQASRAVFGNQDPMLIKASQIQEAMAGKDMNKPEDMASFARELAAKGYTNEAIQIAQQARSMTTEATKLGLQEREVAAREKSAEAAAGFDALNIITKDGRLVRMNKATGKVQVEDKETGETRDFDPRKDVLEYKTSEDPLKAMMAMLLMGSMGGLPSGSPKPPPAPKSDSKSKPSKPLNPADYTAP